MVFVQQSAGRLMRAVHEVCLGRGWAQLARRALELCKCVDHRMWPAQTPLRQFHGMPDELCRSLERRDMEWERLLDLAPADLGELVRKPALGKVLHKLVHTFPRVELQAGVLPVTRSVLRVDLTVTPDFRWDSRLLGSAVVMWCIVEDADQEVILHHEQFALRQKQVEAGEDVLLTFTVPVTEPAPPVYFVRVVADAWIGAEALLPLPFRKLILPEKNVLPMEPRDMQPAVPKDLRDPVLIRCLEEQGIHEFNPVQTQAFQPLFRSDANAVVAAPCGSGKTLCAELAIMRAF